MYGEISRGEPAICSQCKLCYYSIQGVSHTRRFRCRRKHSRSFFLLIHIFFCFCCWEYRLVPGPSCQFWGEPKKEKKNWKVVSGCATGETLLQEASYLHVCSIFEQCGFCRTVQLQPARRLTDLRRPLSQSQTTRTQKRSYRIRLAWIDTVCNGATNWVNDSGNAVMNFQNVKPKMNDG